MNQNPGERRLGCSVKKTWGLMLLQWSKAGMKWKSYITATNVCFSYFGLGNHGRTIILGTEEAVMFILLK